MKKIEIGTLVRLKFKSVRYSQYDLRSEKIEHDEDKPVGIVIKHAYRLLIGSDGDYIPLNETEITLLSTKSQVDQWERQKKLQKLLDKIKRTS